jgi:hypothetical protein
MKFTELLERYPRIAIAGAPGTGKSFVTHFVSDRPVIHTDDWMEEDWREVPALVAAACAGLPAFVVEGVRAPDAMRKAGLEVDAVLWLSKPKEPQTDAQRAMGVGVHTVLEQWAALHPEVPIVTEDQLTMPTLDHADLPAKTRRYAAWTLDASQIERTPQGGLRIPARVSKAGVFKYQRGERVLREYRPASELKKAAALASLKGAPVVVLHPDVNGGAVDTENARDLQVGHFEDPFFNEETQAVEGYVVTNDADTIRRIDAGELADISCAYDNGRDFSPGFTPEREPFDVIQTDYVYNHVALGPPGWGRQGQDVGLMTLDSNDNQVAALPPSTPSEEPMVAKADDKNAANASDKTKTKDAAEEKPAGAAAADKPPETKDEGLSPEDLIAFKKVCAMLPELNKLINAGNPGAAPAPLPTAEGGELPKTGDSEEKKTLDHRDIERIAQEGVEVRTEAINVLGGTYSPKGKSTREVRVDVIRTFDSKFTADGLSEEAVTTAYSIALKAGLERNKNADELGKTRRRGTSTQDGVEPERKALGHQAFEAWKN